MKNNDIMKTYGIKSYWFSYTFLSDGGASSIDVNASDKEKIEFMISILNDYGFTDDLASIDDDIKSFSFDGKDYLSGGNTYNWDAVIPRDINFRFYDYNGKVLVVVGVHTGVDIRAGYVNFYKLYDNIEEAENDIYEITDFEITGTIVFKDGSELYVSSPNVVGVHTGIDSSEDNSLASSFEELDYETIKDVLDELIYF